MIALSRTTCPSDVKELFGIPQKIFIASARRMRQAIAAAQAFSDGGQSLPGLPVQKQNTFQPLIFDFDQLPVLISPTFQQ